MTNGVMIDDNCNHLVELKIILLLSKDFFSVSSENCSDILPRLLSDSLLVVDLLDIAEELS